MRLGLVGLALLSTVPARADSVTTAPEDGFVRLDFTFTTPAQLKAAADNGVLTLSFDRKITLDPQTIVGLSNGAIASGHADAGGKTFALRPEPAGSSCIRVSWTRMRWWIWRRRISPAPCPIWWRRPNRTQAGGCRFLARDQAAHRRLREFHAAGVRLAARCLLSRVSRRGKNDHPLRQRRRGPIFRAIARFRPPWVKNASWRIDGTVHRRGVRDRFRFRLSRFQGRHPCRAGYSGAQDRWRLLCAARHGQAAGHRHHRRSPMPRPRP